MLLAPFSPFIRLHRYSRCYSSEILKSKGILKSYDKKVAQGQIQEDLHQRAVILHLATLQDDLVAFEEQLKQAQQSSFLKSLFYSTAPKAPKGIYLYGDVGK